VKITMRLVPNQSTKKIDQLFRDYVKKITPDCVKLSFLPHHGGDPVLVPRDARFMDEAIEAMKYGFGRDPFFVREGGSIPIISTMKQELGVNTLLLGFGLPDDNAHAPNEKFRLKDYERGILTSAKFMQLCGK
jgi:acetylornithine deacetylase/succinyl-diaminopimelate desuccinylase-like protein